MEAKMKIRRVMIAAPKSGSGKTIVTCALLQTLKDSGWQTAAYKCGPDYIDPMYHRKVIGVPSKNLDTFFTDEVQTKKLFLKSRTENDFAVMEGVMGVYDGLGGVREEGSSYHLACVTKTPVVFVVDAKGMGRSMIPLLAGFLSYDKEHLIRGVILNRISKGYYEIIKPLIEEELPVKVIGFLPEKETYQIGSRHLGLFMPDELGGVKEKLHAASVELQKTVSVDTIIKIAESAQEIHVPEETELQTDAQRKAVIGNKPATESHIPMSDDAVTIAVARDEAFCFHYEDNIALLEKNGANIRYFSPLRDEKLSADCHAVLLGGGYPELYAKKLSDNKKMHEAIKSASESGMPIVAECGGFLYLHRTMTDREGICYPMAGVIPADCYDTGKSVRFGYIELCEKQSSFLPENASIRGHEFHYFDSTDNGADAMAKKPASGKTYPCMIIDETHWMGFPHLYYPSNPAFVKSLIEKACQYKEKMFSAIRQANACEDM